MLSALVWLLVQKLVTDPVRVALARRISHVKAAVYVQHVPGDI